MSKVVFMGGPRDGEVEELPPEVFHRYVYPWKPEKQFPYHERGEVNQTQSYFEYKYVAGLIIEEVVVMAPPHIDSTEIIKRLVRAYANRDSHLW